MNCFRDIFVEIREALLNSNFPPLPHRRKVLPDHHSLLSNAERLWPGGETLDDGFHVPILGKGDGLHHQFESGVDHRIIQLSFDELFEKTQKGMTQYLNDVAAAVDGAVEKVRKMYAAGTIQ